MVDAGFVDFAVAGLADVFSGAPQHSSAAEFGTLGVNIRARKPANAAEWEAYLRTLVCEVTARTETTGSTTLEAHGK